MFGQFFKKKEEKGTEIKDIPFRIIREDVSDPMLRKEIFSNLVISEDSKRVLALAKTDPLIKDRRFAIYARMEAKEKKTYVYFYPSVPAGIDSKDEKTKRDHYRRADGTDVVVKAEDVLTGLVHQQAKILSEQEEKKEEEKKEDQDFLFVEEEKEEDESKDLGCALTFFVDEDGSEGWSFAARSTMQRGDQRKKDPLKTGLQRLDPLIRSAFLFNAGRFVYKPELQNFQPYEEQPENVRQYTEAIHIERALNYEDTLIFSKSLFTIIAPILTSEKGAPKFELDWGTELIREYEKVWEVDAKQKKETTKNGLLNTIYIVSFLNYAPRGRLWNYETDAEEVKIALELAKEYEINIDVNAVPLAYRDKTRTPALIFAVRKNDLELIKVLLNHGADLTSIDDNKKSVMENAFSVLEKLRTDLKEATQSGGLLDSIIESNPTNGVQDIRKVTDIITKQYPDFYHSSITVNDIQSLVVTVVNKEDKKEQEILLKQGMSDLFLKRMNDCKNMITYLQACIYINENNYEKLEEILADDEKENSSIDHSPIDQVNLFIYALSKNANLDVITTLIKSLKKCYIDLDVPIENGVSLLDLVKQKKREDILEVNAQLSRSYDR